MNAQNIVKTSGADEPRYQQLAEKAWQMWHKANQIADELWNEFEPYFVDKCIEEMQNDLPDMPDTD